MISKSRKSALLWRVPLVVALITALFWGIYYLIAGSVPVVTSVQWESKTIQLNFAISRWTDVFFAPLWAFFTLAAFLTYGEMFERDEGEYLHLPLKPDTVLIVGLTVGLKPDTVLIVGLTVGLLIGSVIGLFYGLFFGLFYGLLVELVVILVMVLLAGLVVVLGVGLTAVTKFIFSRSTWRTGWHWLIAADKQ